MPNTAFMHSFYSLYQTKNGGIHLLKIFVEEALSNNQKEIFKRGYQLKDIKKVADIPNSVHSPKGGLTEDTSSTTYNISDLYEFVKTYDKDFVAAPSVNEKLLNEDGTPKVFYHGTRSRFTTFELHSFLFAFFLIALRLKTSVFLYFMEKLNKDGKAS